MIIDLFGIRTPIYWQADGTGGGGATGGGTTEPAPDPADDPVGGADDLDTGAFDADRAKKLIDKLRGEVKQGKATAKELADAKTKLTELERAQMTEADRIKADAADKGEKLTAAEAQLRQERIERMVERSARKLNVVDEDAALRLLDHGKIEFDDAGAPKNIDALLSQLVKDKPYLIAAEARSGGSPALPNRSSAGALTMDQIKNMSPQQVADNWDAVNKVMYPKK